MKEIFSLVAIILTFVGFVPYIKSILKGKTKPHIFTWVTWFVATFVVFLAQFVAGAGVGSWPVLVSALLTLYVVVLAYKNRGDVSVTRADWVFFVVAMSALPFWYFTSNPLWAVVILTLVDLCAYGPTFRKSYANPYTENMMMYFIMTLRNVMILLALENYTLTTALFQYATGGANIVLIFMVLARRRVVG